MLESIIRIYLGLGIATSIRGIRNVLAHSSEYMSERIYVSGRTWALIGAIGTCLIASITIFTWPVTVIRMLKHEGDDR